MNILYTILTLLVCIILGYIFGSIPSGVIIGKLHGIDISAYGSHNTGGTNVGRTLGKKAGITTMALDMLKCIIPLNIALLIFSFTPLLNYLVDYRCIKELFISVVALFVLLGHTFPLFNHFQGGKAVASFAGYMIFISPALCVIGCISFFTILHIKHRVSLSSIISVPIVFISSLVPMILDFTVLNDINMYNGGIYITSNYMVHISYLTCIAILLSTCLIVYRHKANIKRIQQGIEPETHFQNIIDKEKEN